MVSNTTFSYAILSWFRDNGRALPWRDTTDPYPIWLSEVILQQTRIAQGWEYWERFMRYFPTVEALASASEDEVLRLWQGLGYYSRARNLHAAARQIVALGQFPSTLEGIRQLKGVGDYTAAAIASFAFGIRAAVVDGNVYRVLSRHFGISTPINSTQGKKEFAALAQSLLPPSEVSAYNQGIMDFGALQCTPLSPRCSDCPLMESCEAFRTGRVEELPVKQRKLQIKTRRLAYIYIRCRESASSQAFTAIHRRGRGRYLAGVVGAFQCLASRRHPCCHSIGDIAAVGLRCTRCSSSSSVAGCEACSHPSHSPCRLLSSRGFSSSASSSRLHLDSRVGNRLLWCSPPHREDAERGS